MTRIALVLVAVTATVSLAEAQPMESFHQLRPLLEEWDRLTVTDTGGRTQEGYLLDWSPSSLTLLIDGLVRDVNEAEIMAISRPTPDSNKNGALWGFLAGAGLMGASLSASPLRHYPLASAGVAALFGGIGASIGAGVDTLIKGSDSQVIYRSRRRLSVAPLLSRDRRGVAVSLGF